MLPGRKRSQGPGGTSHLRLAYVLLRCCRENERLEPGPCRSRGRTASGWRLVGSPRRPWAAVLQRLGDLGVPLQVHRVPEPPELLAQPLVHLAVGPLAVPECNGIGAAGHAHASVASAEGLADGAAEGPPLPARIAGHCTATAVLPTCSSTPRSGTWRRAGAAPPPGTPAPLFCGSGGTEVVVVGTWQQRWSGKRASNKGPAIAPAAAPAATAAAAAAVAAVATHPVWLQDLRM